MSTVTAEHIKGLTLNYLAVNYDNPIPIPKFHMEMWDLCCSDNPKVAIAAPRLHAKSTAITHTYTLMMLLSRVKRFCLIISSTEALAIEFLGDIKAELEENEALRQKFRIKKFLKEKVTNVVCQLNNGHQFRIQVKGSEQKVRGLKWRGKRPDLIICDDLEGDEQVMNPERREKFRNWFMNALLPCGSDSCSIRIVGTILHLDSMLNRLLDDKTWKTKLYQAVDGNFKNILWPEKFSEERLRYIRAGYEAQNNLEGWSQEYLNNPIAAGNTYFNKDYFFDFERDESMFEKLEGPNSIAYTEGDAVALAKALSKYARDNPAFSFRAGMVEGQVLSLAELQGLATLPAREELYARLLGLLQAPAQRLAALLNAPGQKLAALLSQAEKEKKFQEASLPRQAS